MTDPMLNKYRAAMQLLQRGRDAMVENLADEILDYGDALTDTGFLFNEFLESQGTRLHFLCLLMSQLEQSAEALDEVTNVSMPAPSKPARRRSRAKKVHEPTSKKGPEEDL